MQKLNKTLLCENIDSIAQYDFSENKVFGSAYYVYQEDHLSIEKCYGKISLDKDAPVANNTLFRLASMTKPITAFATLILVDRGMLSLDEPVDKFLPDFRNISVNDNCGNCFKPINMPTVRNILTHTSGIGSIAEKLAAMTDHDRKTTNSYISYLIGVGLDFEPGSKQQYSGTGAFDVLVKIIETVSGMDYLSFLKKEIFEPCGMADTTFEPTDEQYERLADMHDRINGKNTISKMPEGCIFADFPCQHYLGGAGLVSTLNDYSCFAKMLLNCGKTDNKQLINKNTFSRLYTPQVPESIMPRNERWGLGVRVITKEAYPYLPVGSFGWSGAYGSHFWVDPANRIFAVFMKNSKVDGGAGNESARNFEKAVCSALE